MFALLRKSYKELDSTPKSEIQILSGEMNVAAICVMFAKNLE